MPPPRGRLMSAGIVALLVLGGCAAQDRPAAPSPFPEAASSPAPAAEARPSEPRATGPGSRAPSPTDPSAPPPRPRRLRGIDVSHHQGPIDWRRVAASGISFAYLKATEGSTFTDPRFGANRIGAGRAGLSVGGYHYFTLCSAPLPQADHFVGTLRAAGLGRGSLPPAVDLELIGSCDPPPDRSTLLAAVRAFIDRVEAGTGQAVVVYVHPDFEKTYRLAGALERRLWVRRVGDRPPRGPWWMWQRSDHARVPGVAAPVDLDVLRGPLGVVSQGRTRDRR